MDSQQALRFALDLLGALPSWAIFFAVAFATVALALTIGAGLFLKAYFQQRGTLKAQADALDEIVRDLRVTTAAVRAIETEIEFRSWHAKEENTLRREKLETLLRAALAHYTWIRNYGRTQLFEITEASESEVEPTLDSLIELYFTELKDVAKGFTTAVDVAALHGMEARMARLGRWGEVPIEERTKWMPNWTSRIPPTEQERMQYHADIKTALVNLLAFKSACGELMKELRPAAEPDSEAKAAA